MMMIMVMMAMMMMMMMMMTMTMMMMCAQLLLWRKAAADHGVRVWESWVQTRSAVLAPPRAAEHM